MELAILDREERLFDEYVAQMEGADLDPRLGAYFTYFRGLGFRRFGRENADEILVEARDYASKNQLNQLTFEIENSLQLTEADLQEETVPPSTSSEEPDSELKRIAEVLGHLREDTASILH
jgi:hypothetical protein